MQKLAIFVLFFLFFTLVPSCTTISDQVARGVEVLGQTADGSRAAEKVTSRYRIGGGKGDVAALVWPKKKGALELLVTLEEMPHLKLYGTLPDEGGAFHFTHATLLSSGLLGWNEVHLNLSGTGVLIIEEKTATLTMEAPPERVAVTGGRVQRGSVRLTGAQALTALQNRSERIEALVEWMHSGEAPMAFPNAQAFESYWKQSSLRSELPEELLPVQQSGTLLLDWEEAAPWIYLAYQWPYMLQSLQKEMP
jgi:hypothetical protein